MKAQIKKASAVAERLGYAERVRYSPPRIDTEGLFPEPKIEVLVDRTS